MCWLRFLTPWRSPSPPPFAETEMPPLGGFPHLTPTPGPMAAVTSVQPRSLGGTLSGCASTAGLEITIRSVTSFENTYTSLEISFDATCSAAVGRTAPALAQRAAAALAQAHPPVPPRSLTQNLARQHHPRSGRPFPAAATLPCSCRHCPCTPARATTVPGWLPRFPRRRHCSAVQGPARHRCRGLRRQFSVSPIVFDAVDTPDQSQAEA